MTREDAIDVLKCNYPSSCFQELCKAVDIAIQALSAEPERKKGKWEAVPHKSVQHGEVVIDGKTVLCSECRHAEKGWNSGMRFCPNCGADMRGEKDDIR